MKVEAAYKLINKKFPEMHVYACHEYDSVFVFNMCTHKEKDSLPKVRGIMWSVNKITGEDKVFLPFHISAEEYKKGKEITKFK